MTQPLNPLDVTKRITDDYMRYLRTINFFQDSNLRQQFWQALEQPGFLVRGPILEAAPPFKRGHSIQALVQDGVLHNSFRNLCTDALPFERPLYLHQDQAIVKLVKHRRNVVVSTGTGSGKTETFLVPIFDHLLRERDQGKLQQPGVRALLLYPMNALANDQLKRLRKLLVRFPDITFGRYVGETEEKQAQAEKLFAEQFPKESKLPNELLSREQMRANPPHILLTNFAMLEYLLLRPKDSEFFDGQTGRHWRFLVLDEAHIYDGAAGIELAMLLRRLKDRVIMSEPSRLTCIATSATLGKGEKDFPVVVRFAQELFGERFEWKVEDSERQDVVKGTREQNAQLASPWGTGSSILYACLLAAISQNEPITTLTQLIWQHGVPEFVIAEARQAADSSRELQESYNRFLHALLRGDANLHQLRDNLTEPMQLSKVVEKLRDGNGASDKIIHLVNLAVRARHTLDEVSLLPARYHVFARALEGAFICLNQEHPVHVQESKPWLFLNRHETCPHCQSRVFELATCPRCGTAYIVGREIVPEGKNYKILIHPSSISDGLSSDIIYFTLTKRFQEMDEDDVVVSGESIEQIEHEQLEEVTVCLGCGAFGSKGSSLRCQCPPDTAKRSLQRVETQKTPLRRCVSCGVHSPVGVIYRFLTGRDAPVSVLATSLYQQLPAANNKEMAERPGEGRKLMIFSDSRQDAAFFAPYLERTYQQILRRCLILRALTNDSAGCSGQLRLQDAADYIRREGEANHLFLLEQSNIERQRLALEWLMQEFVALDKRIGLEGLGLLHFRPVEPASWEPPAALLALPWSFTKDEIRTLIAILLDSIRQQGAVTFPDNIDVKSSAFEPRNVKIHVSDYADSKSYVIGWLPKRGSNRRVGYLKRFLLTRQPTLTVSQAEQAAKDLLEGLWRFLTSQTSPWRIHFVPEMLKSGIGYQINHKLWEWVPSQAAATSVYYCELCFNITHHNLNDVCPRHGCQGSLKVVNVQSTIWRSNHYRNLYQNLVPIDLSVEEHTAQWTPKAASDIQNKFINGQINALSCSTTFELGVDVGELQTVLMRNVPPTTANYVQRAGRAGRRTDSAAFVLTFAQRRSHDLTCYRDPERMVGGQVNPPVVVIENEKIVRRHVHSVCLAAFLRWTIDEHHRHFESVGDFFVAQSGMMTGPELFQQFVDMRPSHVQNALQRIVPDSLKAEIGVDDWRWLTQLTGSDKDGVLDRTTQDVVNELNLYMQLEKEAANEGAYDRAKHFKAVSNTVQKRDLLGFLGAHNVLPKYGFPVDVVDLRTEHIPVKEASRIELDRDLRMAISEYAPGSKVVAAKKIWSGGGINLIPGHALRSIAYAVCPSCGRFHRSIEQEKTICTTCGANMFEGPARNGKFIIPQFGFIAKRDTEEPGEGRPERTYSSQIYFSRHDHETQEPRRIKELSSGAIEVKLVYSRFGELAVVNSGKGNAGFRICMNCGWAEQGQPITVGVRTRQQTHKNPRTGRPCPESKIETYHLGHEFTTDVLELRLSGYLAPLNNNDLWLSLLYATLEGTSEALGIARDDLNGTIYPYSRHYPPALLLFDNVPGGAGHVRRLDDPLVLVDVLRTALNRVTRCDCGEETSCYECLRNFYNQQFHDQLHRGLVRDFLHQVFEHSSAQTSRLNQ